MKLIYLACPYYHESDVVRLYREKTVAETAGALLLSRKLNVFSPLSHSLNIGQFVEFPQRFGDFHSAKDFNMLSKCDSLAVLTLSGWEISVGVWAEIGFATGKNIPITYLEIEDGCNNWITVIERDIATFEARRKVL